MVFVRVSPSIVGLLFLVSLSLVCSEESELCPDCDIDVPYEFHPTLGRKLLQTPADFAERKQSLVPVLTNRRSLMLPMCSETDDSVDAVVHCTNAVRMSPNSFDYSCSVTNMEGGLGALSKNGDLMKAAQSHSEDNARMGHLTHTGSDGSHASTRVGRTGYSSGTVRENIAYGFVSARSVVLGWMCSSGHRKNIMSCDIADIGVGLAPGGDGRYYHTQVFACPRGKRCSCSGGDGQPSEESSGGKEPSVPKEEPVDPSKKGDGKEQPYKKFYPKEGHGGGYLDFLSKFGYGSEKPHSAETKEMPKSEDPYLTFGEGQGSQEGSGSDPHGTKMDMSGDGEHIYVSKDGELKLMRQEGGGGGGFLVSLSSSTPSHGGYSFGHHGK